jgi:hypothetical protein
MGTVPFAPRVAEGSVPTAPRCRSAKANGVRRQDAEHCARPAPHEMHAYRAFRSVRQPRTPAHNQRGSSPSLNDRQPTCSAHTNDRAERHAPPAKRQPRALDVCTWPRDRVKTRWRTISAKGWRLATTPTRRGCSRPRSSSRRSSSSRAWPVTVRRSSSASGPGGSRSRWRRAASRSTGSTSQRRWSRGCARSPVPRRSVSPSGTSRRRTSAGRSRSRTSCSTRSATW